MERRPSLTIRTPRIYESTTPDTYSPSNSSEQTTPQHGWSPQTHPITPPSFSRNTIHSVWHPVVLYTVFAHTIPMVTAFVCGMFTPYPEMWLFLIHNIFVFVYILLLLAYQIYKPTTDSLAYEFFVDSVYISVFLTLYETVWLVVSGTQPIVTVLLCVARMALACTNRHCTAKMRDIGVLLWHAADSSHRMCLLSCIMVTMLSTT